MATRHKTLALKAVKEVSKPRPFIVKNLLACSRSQDFDEAKEEWTVQYLIDETAEGFSSQCHLCHNPHLKYNFVLENTLTGNTIQVGSTCILRFGVGLGKMDIESGRVFLSNMIEEQDLLNFLQTNAAHVMTLRPEARILRKYWESLRKYFSLRGIAAPTEEQLGLAIFGENWAEKDTFRRLRMKTLFHNPGSIEATYVKKVRKDKAIKEGSTWYKRRKRVETSLAKSNVYNIEGYVIDKR